jgi:hypothetical protein
MPQISKTSAEQLMRSSKGRIFSVTAATKGNPNRLFNVRLSVTKGVKGTGKSTKSLGLLKVYDMQKKSFRTVNLQNVSALKINKQSYIVK